MAAILTKQGGMDNVVTYEYICDTAADLVNLDARMGSVATVIEGESGLEVYMANSHGQWINISGAGSAEEDDD